MPQNRALARHFLTMIKRPPVWAQVLNVVGEAGEFAEAYRRYSGNARRTAELDEVRHELADVVISAYCASILLDFNLDAAISEKWAVIFERGFGNQDPDVIDVVHPPAFGSDRVVNLPGVLGGDDSLQKPME